MKRKLEKKKKVFMSKNKTNKIEGLNYQVKFKNKLQPILLSPENDVDYIYV